MRNIDSVEVFFDNRKVGILASYDKNLTAFQYAPEWVETGFSISPFSLQLTDKLFISRYEPFTGMFGVFDDHLPDGWGRLITDRYLLCHRVQPETMSELTRLTLLSKDSFGGLEFRPKQYKDDYITDIDFDNMYEEIQKITTDFSNKTSLDDLFMEGGSSGGARPKINVLLDGHMYLVKFPNSGDGRNMGRMEYDYMQCAKACGIEIPEIKLIPSKYTDGFLAVKRFDRPFHTHMISLCGLLETSHRIPSLDYGHIFKSILILTKSEAEMERMFRLMCFNVFAENMDDHGKNFAFMRDMKSSWKLTPAYDLTHCIRPYSERSTTVNGKGKDITVDDLLSYTDKFHMDRNHCRIIAEEIRTIVREQLSGYLE